MRNVATGALVAQVNLPDPNLDHGGRTYLTAVATADGHHYLVAIYGNPCRSWLYQFQLNDQGQPGPVTPFAALPTVSSQLNGLTISANGQMIAYTLGSCMGATARPFYVAATSVRTGQTTRWTVTGGAGGDASLTADGSELLYTLPGPPAAIRVIPTSAAPGNAADRGRTVLRTAQFAPADSVTFAAISPDGKSVYFSTSTESATAQAGPIRVLNLATGRTRVVYQLSGWPGLVTADPLVRHLLLQINGKGQSRVPPKLASLDLATGKVTYLPNGWVNPLGVIVTW